ncbi:hypothetical protein C6571_15935 [Simplicispira suum]|uniref:Uncharacterized protein n=1 Tax=Simplicispira suum TaxID=2109915 RepID=A0A2S0N376_9BURK|nr:hypothetical protein C6571_15935 [Simplicispira suum]
MPNFPQRVRDNILPLSENQTLAEAFDEWRHAVLEVWPCHPRRWWRGGGIYLVPAWWRISQW